MQRASQLHRQASRAHRAAYALSQPLSYASAMCAAVAVPPCPAPLMALSAHRSRFFSTRASVSPSSAAAAAASDRSTAALITPPPAPLFVTTRHTVAGRRITRDLGLVAASAFRSRNLLVDVAVAITRIFGGETPDYTQLLNETTEKATLRLEATARAAGATSVVSVRYATTTTMNRMIVGLHCSVLATGTAVVDEPEGEDAGVQSEQQGRTVPLLRTPTSTQQQQSAGADAQS